MASILGTLLPSGEEGTGCLSLRRAQTGGGLDTGLHASLESPLTAVTGSDSVVLGASGSPGQPWSL